LLPGSGRRSAAVEKKAAVVAEVNFRGATGQRIVPATVKDPSE
jgi:hypothetical protein